MIGLVLLLGVAFIGAIALIIIEGAKFLDDYNQNVNDED